MRRCARKIAVLLMVVFLISSCGGGSDLPPPKWQRVEEATVAERKFSPEGEYYLGRAVAANILGRHGYFDNAQAGRYVSLLTTYMAYVNDLPVPFNGFNVTILETEAICAFSAPGGHLLISKGLLMQVRSEEELAGVIAHELAHLESNDGIRSVGRSKATSMLSAIGTLAVSLVGGGGLASALLQTFEGAVNHAVTDLTAKGFSRQQELAADKSAIGLMTRCGYPASAYLDFMDRVLGEHHEEQAAIFSTHPMSNDRIERLRVQVANKADESTRVPARDRRFNLALGRSLPEG